MESVIQFCFEETQAIFFAIGNIPPFILYTHLPAGIIAVLIAFFVLHKGRGNANNLPNKILSLSLFFFAYWVFANVIIWGTVMTDVIMFLWSLQILFEPMVYMGIAYMVFNMLSGHDLSFKIKILIAALFIPFVLIIPTKLNLFGFNLTECIPIETYPAFYSYVLEVSSIVFIAILSIVRYRKESDITTKKKIIPLAFGSIFFLLAFGSGNLFGSLTGEWVKTQFGLLGMPIFAAALAYLVVKYRIFNTRLLSTEVLVGGLWLLVFSLIFVRRIEIILWILVPTLVLLIAMGYLLIRTTKREVKQRQQLERLSGELYEANKKLKELDQLKTEFLSIASHQLRTPLSGIKGYLSMMIDGDFGKFSGEQAGILDRVKAEVDRLVRLVQDFLNVSRIESGKLQIAQLDFNFCDIVKTVITELEPTAKTKGLELTYICDKDQIIITGDSDKLKDVVVNLVDNAIKYTKKGKVWIEIKKFKDEIQVEVHDSGVGVNPKEIGKLFNKFQRAKGIAKVSPSGTGLGLYTAKKIVSAHHGDIWAESKGEGEGSVFAFKIPIKPVNIKG